MGEGQYDDRNQHNTKGQYGMVVEPISASLGILASILSIASSVQQLLAKRSELEREEALEKFIEESATDKEVVLLKQTEIREAVLEVSIISEKLMQQLSKEAEACENNHIEARNVAKTQIEKDEADINAAQCMCSVLRDLYRYNKKALPAHGPFKNWWDSYGCKL